MGVENNYIQTITDISYMFYHVSVVFLINKHCRKKNFYFQGLKYAIDKGKIFLACNTLYTALSGYTDWKGRLDDAFEQHKVPVPASYLHLSESRTVNLNKFRRSVNSALNALKSLSEKVNPSKQKLQKANFKNDYILFRWKKGI